MNEWILQKLAIPHATVTYVNLNNKQSKGQAWP